MRRGHLVGRGRPFRRLFTRRLVTSAHGDHRERPPSAIDTTGPSRSNNAVSAAHSTSSARGKTCWNRGARIACTAYEVSAPPTIPASHQQSLAGVIEDIATGAENDARRNERTKIIEDGSAHVSFWMDSTGVARVVRGA